MSLHAPVFLKKEIRKNSDEFAKRNKEDILATIEFLYKRGMWSKFHYEQWKKEAESCIDPIILHGWWDAIVGGAMFEVDFEEIKEIQEEGLGGCSREGLSPKMKMRYKG